MYAQKKRPNARLLAKLAGAGVAPAMDAAPETYCHCDLVWNAFDRTNTFGDVRAIFAARRAKAGSPSEIQVSFAEAPSPAVA